MPKHIGLDLGTSNTRMYIRGQGIVLRSSTVIALDKNSDELVALGNQAKLMIGKTPENIVVYRPIKKGVVADYDVAATMVNEYLKRTESLSLFNRPVVLTALNENCTEVEEMALTEIILRAGARAVGVVPSSIATAVGAGLKIRSPKGCMLVDIGGGSTNIAVISSGEIVASRRIEPGGLSFDRAIGAMLQAKKDLNVGELDAEILKVRVGAAAPGLRAAKHEVCGINTRHKCIQTLPVTTEELSGVITSALDAICRNIMGVFRSIPTELANDISEYGIMLTGGGACMPGVPNYINQKTRLRVTLAKNPMDSQIIGLGRLIETPGLISGGIIYRNK